MSTLPEYKGFQGTLDFSQEDHVLCGKVLHIDSLLTYEGSTLDEILNAFHEAVDDYLDYCIARGIEPNKPFKGSFNVRVGTERHRALAHEAAIRKTSINDLICIAVDALLNPTETTHNHHNQMYILSSDIFQTKSTMSADKQVLIYPVNSLEEGYHVQ